jgi:hypothetical protein
VVHQEVKPLFELAKDYGITDDYLILTPACVRPSSFEVISSIIRGLFRKSLIIDVLGNAERHFIGGRRYDRLLDFYGGDKCEMDVSTLVLEIASLL